MVSFSWADATRLLHILYIHPIVKKDGLKSYAKNLGRCILSKNMPLNHTSLLTSSLEAKYL